MEILENLCEISIANAFTSIARMVQSALQENSGSPGLKLAGGVDRKSQQKLFGRIPVSVPVQAGRKATKA